MALRDGESRPRRRRGGSACGTPQAARIDEILEALRAHGERLRETWQQGEAGRLALLAGELRVLAGDSDDAAMVRSAAELEAMLLAEEAETSAMCEKVESLIQLCRGAMGQHG